MPHDVFVSYPSKEKPTADAAVTALETAGTRCWIAPRDVPPGADWAASIVDAIEHSRLMVLVFSDATNESSHILREVREAADANIPILPFRITPTEPSAALQYYVGGTHWLDALTPDLDGHLTDLAAQVGDLLTDRPAEPRPTPARTPVPVPAPRSNTALMVVGTLVAIAILLLAGTWLFAPGTDTAPTTAPLAADDTEAPATTTAPAPTLSPSTTRTQTTIVVEDTSAAPTGYLGFQPSILAIANEFGPSRICVLGGEEASCVDITPTDVTFMDVAIADLNGDELPDVVFAAVGGMVDPITRQGSVGSGAHNTLCLATGAGG
ncbi:MAG: toll/interleukin-1 receptor domain-containing protein, partial [Acidimicrobiia bacterium]|nr:toll/interleukin-1 receptor domain-containing protein [Acidimicrobiia bacterium]